MSDDEPDYLFEHESQEKMCPICKRKGYMTIIFPDSKRTFRFESGGEICVDYSASAAREQIRQELREIKDPSDDYYQEMQKDILFIDAYYHPDD